MNDDESTKYGHVQPFKGAPFSYRREVSRAGRRWWLKLGGVVLASVAAVLLILVGAVRFLEAAERQRDQVECVREQVQHQARGNADMAAAVLDERIPIADRQRALRTWADDQADVASAAERC